MIMSRQDRFYASAPALSLGSAGRPNGQRHLDPVLAGHLPETDTAYEVARPAPCLVTHSSLISPATENAEKEFRDTNNLPPTRLFQGSLAHESSKVHPAGKIETARPGV